MKRLLWGTSIFLLSCVLVYQCTHSILSSVAGLKGLISTHEIEGLKGAQERLQELIDRSNSIQFVRDEKNASKPMTYEEFIVRYREIAKSEKKLLEKLDLIVNKFDNSGFTET